MLRPPEEKEKQPFRYLCLHLDRENWVLTFLRITLERIAPKVSLVLLRCVKNCGQLSYFVIMKFIYNVCRQTDYCLRCNNVIRLLKFHKVTITTQVCLWAWKSRHYQNIKIPRILFRFPESTFYELMIFLELVIWKNHSSDEISNNTFDEVLLKIWVDNRGKQNKTKQNKTKQRFQNRSCVVFAGDKSFKLRTR